MTPYEKNLHLLTAHCTADANLAAAAGKLIDMAPSNERSALFMRFLYEFRYTPTDKSSSIFEEFKEEPQKDVVASKRIIDRFVDAHKNTDMNEEEFHEKLWELICEKAGDSSRQKAIFLRACTLITDLPYINKTKAMTMTQKGFENEEAKIDPICGAMIRHVGSQHFTQITEDASMFLPIIENGKDERERAILLSLVLMTFRAKMIPPSLQGLLDDEDE